MTLASVKTVIQAAKRDHKGKRTRKKSNSLSALSLLLKIFKEEGLRGFYKGYAATMLNTFSNRAFSNPFEFSFSNATYQKNTHTSSFTLLFGPPISNASLGGYRQVHRYLHYRLQPS